ncbi:hypothetical protein LCGC14_2750540 [marine sediment metagenome]|uniref:Uncharacterized protein n=1 Tax=marine sediment metagenome TaxID=412755 RepID=A0A0F9BAI0_9ZZZZ|nr:hypothetical protein [Candidatus Scalindua sediminis]
MKKNVDVEEITDLFYEISSLRKEVNGLYGNVNVTIAPFAPKAHTQFKLKWRESGARRVYDILDLPPITIDM